MRPCVKITDFCLDCSVDVPPHCVADSRQCTAFIVGGALPLASSKSKVGSMSDMNQLRTLRSSSSSRKLMRFEKESQYRLNQPRKNSFLSNSLRSALVVAPSAVHRNLWTEDGLKSPLTGFSDDSEQSPTSDGKDDAAEEDSDAMSADTPEDVEEDEEVLDERAVELAAATAAAAISLAKQTVDDDDAEDVFDLRDGLIDTKDEAQIAALAAAMAASTTTTSANAAAAAAVAAAKKAKSKSNEAADKAGEPAPAVADAAGLSGTSTVSSSSSAASADPSRKQRTSLFEAEPSSTDVEAISAASLLECNAALGEHASVQSVKELQSTRASDLSTQQFSDYEIHNSVLGTGNYGTVKRATHLPTKQAMAVKIVEKRMTWKKKPDAARFIKREIAVMALLGKTHPHIVNLYGVFDDARYIYLFMELVEGGDLLGYVEQKGNLVEDEAKFIFHQLAVGVKYLHDNGIIHRDLKVRAG